MFNGFSSNSQKWKYAILANIFSWSHICSIFVNLVLKRCHSIGKRLIFPNMKQIACTLNSFCATAHQSWITFFGIHPVYMHDQCYEKALKSIHCIPQSTLWQRLSKAVGIYSILSAANL